MSDAFIGQVVMFAGNFAPTNWAFCNGQSMQISQNTQLFAIIGTTYGGNGTTNFNLPDLSGRVAISSGQGQHLPSYSLGQTGGSPTVTLPIAELPPPSHLIMSDAHGANR